MKKDRLSLRINPRLLASIKSLASHDGVTVTQLVEGVLRQTVAAAEVERRRRLQAEVDAEQI